MAHVIVGSGGIGLKPAGKMNSRRAEIAHAYQSLIVSFSPLLHDVKFLAITCEVRHVK
jgi:hypothetical protein